MQIRNGLVSFLVVMTLCILCSCSPAQLQAPPCGVSCARSAASQTSCNSYNVTCFCNDSQFQRTVGNCISQTCDASNNVAASDYITALCSIGKSSPDTPSSIHRSSTNAAQTLVTDTMVILGGGLCAILAAMM
ncbi:hypothetical protein BC826DRAFT_1023226 [Russula brevipes]|nr:hypothetical protein BC826DRAFT_1023226 [Russula brevipes]